MPLSIWEYIRERARDAVLAGIQDAMDTVEQGDTNGSQHAQANGLESRLNPPKQLTAASGPTATGGATADTTIPEAAQEAAGAAPSHAPGKPRPTPDDFDDDLEKRLQEAAREATAEPTSPPATKPSKLHTPNGQPLKKRGRPRKDGGKDSTV